MRLFQLNEMKTDLISQNRTLRKENLALRQEQKNLSMLPSIEELARESLGFVYPDEVIYILKR